MENASKALMIAGGVLVALLVISLGMFILGKAQDTSVSAEKRRLQTITQEQVNKFSQYSGTIYGAEVENCIRRVYSYNKDKTEDEKIKIYIKKKDNSEPFKDELEPTKGRLPTPADIISTTADNGVKNNIDSTERNDTCTGTISYRINGTIETISFNFN